MKSFPDGDGTVREGRPTVAEAPPVLLRLYVFTVVLTRLETRSIGTTTPAGQLSQLHFPV